MTYVLRYNVEIYGGGGSRRVDRRAKLYITITPVGPPKWKMWEWMVEDSTTREVFGGKVYGPQDGIVAETLIAMRNDVGGVCYNLARSKCVSRMINVHRVGDMNRWRVYGNDT